MSTKASKIIPVLLITAFLFSNRTQAQCDSTIFRYTATLISDVALLDTNKIIAVGDNGYIIKSVDGGRSWKNIQSWRPYFLRAVQFVSDSTGFVVGSGQTILKTEDQGETWFPLQVPPLSSGTNLSSSLNDLVFFDRNRGIIVGSNGIIIGTNDGG